MINCNCIEQRVQISPPAFNYFFNAVKSFFSIAGKLPNRANSVGIKFTQRINPSFSLGFSENHVHESEDYEKKIESKNRRFTSN